MLPLVATRNSAEINEAIASGHGGHTMLGSAGVDANVHANATETASKAKYLLTIPSTGGVDAYQLAARISSKSDINEYTVRMVINATYEAIDKFVSEYGSVVLDTPLGVIETMVANSVENITDELDPEKHYAYLNCTPCREFQRATSGIAYYNATEKTLPYDVDAVRNFATGGDEPFRCGDYVSVRGSNFATGLTVSLVDMQTKTATPATDVTIIGEATLKVRIPVTLNPDHKHKLYVKQTIDGVEWDLPSNKEFSVLPPPLPDHQIIKLKQGERADNTLAFDDNDRVVVTVATNNGASYALRETKPVKIEIDYMDGSSRRHGILDNVAQVSSTATEVTFINRENDSDVADGDWWDHEVELTLYYADGQSATSTITFVRD